MPSLAAIFDIAVQHHIQGDLVQAEALYRQIIAANPMLDVVHSNLGAVLQALRRTEEAIACWEEAVRLNPANVDGHYNLGLSFQDQAQFDRAIGSYRLALHYNPRHVDSHNNLGNVLVASGQIADGITSYQHALRIDPNYAPAHNNMGLAYYALGQLVEAAECYRRALRINSNYANALDNLGAALFEKGQLDEALHYAQSAADLKPDDVACLIRLAHLRQHMFLCQGQIDLAQNVIDAFGKSDAVKAKVPPFSFLTLSVPTSAAQQLRCARAEAGTIAYFEAQPPLWRSQAAPREKIRLGYLSADFHEHATAFLTAELFEAHDRERFDVFGYSFGPDDVSAMRRRLTAAFDRFVDIKDSSHLEAAQRIAADGVDILIDLKGYTKGARTHILALRPAPIQVNYLGYPGTMGADFMDYILVDDFIVPAAQQSFFAEKLVHLPGCYQINDSKRAIAPTPSRADCDLPESGFVFCDFNNTYKITPLMFELWLDLLREVPGSVLWLLEGNPCAAANIRREAEARGVPAQRLVFAPRLPMPEHLARHRLADLFLDTFPVCAHTTASDALWAGCPLLTLVGETFVSRVAGSLLRAVGLPELIATSFEEYRAKALQFAREPERLRELRERLAVSRTTSSLFNSKRFARNLESAYQEMWLRRSV
jgi:protein O-GlcNAc transferase